MGNKFNYSGGNKMALTIKEAKETVTGVLEKLKKSIERETTYLKELEDDKALLVYVQEMMDSGESLPAGSPYASFTEWTEQIKKEIKSGESSISRIDVEKAEIIAFEYFITNAQDDDATV